MGEWNWSYETYWVREKKTREPEVRLLVSFNSFIYIFEKKNMKGNFDNFGTIVEQHFLNEFRWNDTDFYSYLIKFKEHDGLFRIIREKKHLQELVGNKMVFNKNENDDKISKYKIVDSNLSKKKEIKVSKKIESIYKKNPEYETEIKNWNSGGFYKGGKYKQPIKHRLYK